MCDPVLIAAILEELGYFDERKEKDKKHEVSDEESSEESSKNTVEEEKQVKVKIPIVFNHEYCIMYRAS
jgi:hypothetical protein